jgi:hypothetical protein
MKGRNSWQYFAGLHRDIVLCRHTHLFFLPPTTTLFPCQTNAPDCNYSVHNCTCVVLPYCDQPCDCIQLNCVCCMLVWAAVAQSVQWLTTNWTTGVRSPTEDFSSSLCVQTGSGAHPASNPMGTRVLSSGVKRGRGVMLTTHPHLVPRLSRSRSYTSSSPMCLHGM